MAELKTTFRGLNTDIYPLRLPSGTADVALNVERNSGDLSKRQGFAEYEDDVDGSASAVLNLFLTAFADGDIYIIAKCADGYLYHKKVYPGTAAESFTKITGGWAPHSTTDRGWGFMWADRFHYFDRDGGSRWNPDANSAVAYKAGLPRPSVGPTITTATGGEKDGRYHVHVAYRNSVTREQGVFSLPQTGASMPLQCQISDDTGGISVSNWSSIQAADSTYEWDQAVFYCTRGNTEYDGGGSGVEIFSYVAYQDVIAPKAQGSVGLNKHDDVLDPRTKNRNAGGEPPGAVIGCFNVRTGQAVYGGLYAGTNASKSTTLAGDNNDLTYTAVADGPSGNAITVTYTDDVSAGYEVATVSGTAISVAIESGASTAAQVLAAVVASAAASSLVTVANASGNDGTGAVVTMDPGITLTGGASAGGSAVASELRFSIPNYPTMVPKEVTYRIGGDATTVTPEPWVGSVHTGISGDMTAMASGAGRTLAFTPTATYILSGDGKIRPQLLSNSVGAIGQGAAIGCEAGIFAMGYGTVMWYSPAGARNLTTDRIETTLDDIPAAQRTDAVLAWYGHERQLWCAVTKSGDTVAQRILIYDAADSEWSMFEPGCLSASEGVNCMVELSIPNAAPTMLVGTSSGRILQYPSGTDDDGTDFEARWRGWFGTERAQYMQQLNQMRVHCGSNCEDNVAVKVRAMRSSGETVTQREHRLTLDNAVEYIPGVVFDDSTGNVFQIEFASEASVSGRWTIRDLQLEINRL